MKKEIQHPQVNLNGTSGDALLAQYRDTLDKLRVALQSMCENCPHGRDYQTLPNGAHDTALSEHRVRVARVQLVYEEIETLAIGVCDQVVQRERSTR